MSTLFKKRLWHSCFPVNLAKFLRTLFLQNTGRLLLSLEIDVLKQKAKSMKNTCGEGSFLQSLKHESLQLYDKETPLETPLLIRFSVICCVFFIFVLSEHTYFTKQFLWLVVKSEQRRTANLIKSEFVYLFSVLYYSPECNIV